MDGPAESTVSYEEAKRLAADGEVAARRALAEEARVQPEILYFLAEDNENTVRAAVARNPATPAQADKILADDGDDAVRSELAVKVAGHVAELDSEPSEKRRSLVIGVLERLAGDEVVRVRQALAEALKEVAAAPDDVIEQVIRPLSRDPEIDVAGPLLEFSSLLGDDDLLAVLGDEAPNGALVSIARRLGLDGAVVDAVVGQALGSDRSDGDAAIGALLANPSAQIREDTLDRILDAAPERESWHRPLARRPSLPVRAARRLVDFLAETLLDELRDRKDLDPATTKAVAAAVRDRLAAEEPAADEPENLALDRGRIHQNPGCYRGRRAGEPVPGCPADGLRRIGLRGRSLGLGPANVELLIEQPLRPLQPRRSQLRRAMPLCWRAGLAIAVDHLARRGRMDSKTRWAWQ